MWKMTYRWIHVATQKTGINHAYFVDKNKGYQEAMHWNRDNTWVYGILKMEYELTPDTISPYPTVYQGE